MPEKRIDRIRAAVETVKDELRKQIEQAPSRRLAFERAIEIVEYHIDPLLPRVRKKPETAEAVSNG